MTELTILKITKSGKGIQIIDDDGRVFGTSLAYVQSLLSGTLKKKWILFQRMPFDVAPDRFKKSELWIPEGADKAYLEKQKELKDAKLSTNSDVFSKPRQEENKQRKAYKDSW